MPRKTKEEKLAELRAQQEREKLELENFRKDFPRKLVFEILPELTKRYISYRFEKNNDGSISFIVQYDRYDDGDYAYISDIAAVAPYQLSDIEDVITDYDEKQAEKIRRAQLRQSALNKLNEEEKKELGLQ